MIRFIKSKILVISFIVSILLHIGMFAGMYVIYDPEPLYPDKNTQVVFNASLEYVYLPLENEKEAGKKKAAQHKNVTGDSSENESNYPKKQNNKDIGEKEPEKQNIEDLLDREPEQDIITENQSLQDTPIVDSNNSLKNKPKENTDTDQSRNKQNEITQRENIFTALQNKIKNHIVYPPIARKRGMEGIATILFVIDEQGNYLQSRVSKSSGYHILDKAALELIQRVLPFPHSLGIKVEMNISIEYTLR